MIGVLSTFVGVGEVLIVLKLVVSVVVVGCVSGLVFFLRVWGREGGFEGEGAFVVFF